MTTTHVPKTATEKQVQYLRSLGERSGTPYPTGFLSKSAASRMIDKLLNAPKAAPAPAVKAPSEQARLIAAITELWWRLADPADENAAEAHLAESEPWWDMSIHDLRVLRVIYQGAVHTGVFPYGLDYDAAYEAAGECVMNDCDDWR